MATAHRNSSRLVAPLGLASRIGFILGSTRRCAARGNMMEYVHCRMHIRILVHMLVSMHMHKLYMDTHTHTITHNSFSYVQSITKSLHPCIHSQFSAACTDLAYSILYPTCLFSAVRLGFEHLDKGLWQVYGDFKKATTNEVFRRGAVSHHDK